MTDAGFFKGTSADQDSRFSDKNKKLMKTMKFADNIDKKIDMKKIRLELMRPHIESILNALIPIEDDVMAEYVFSQLEEKQHPDGKLIQIMMTGFLGKTKARSFMTELWSTLCEAQSSEHGVPAVLIEKKREELIKKKVEDSKMTASLNKNKEEIERCLNIRDRQPLHQRNEISHQQVSIQKVRSPVRTERNGRYSNSNRSRSRSPKYHQRRNSSRDRMEKKSSRRFKEKTPPLAMKVNVVEENLPKVEDVKISESLVNESGSSDSNSDSGSSSSNSGSDSNSGSSSGSDSDTGSSDSQTTENTKKRKSQVIGATSVSKVLKKEKEELQVEAPLQRILQAEKKKDYSRDDSRREEERQRRKDDERRRDEREKRRKDDDRRREARRIEEAKERQRYEEKRAMEAKVRHEEARLKEELRAKARHEERLERKKAEEAALKAKEMSDSDSDHKKHSKKSKKDKKSKKSSHHHKKSSHSDRTKDTNNIEIEKALREKALESLVRV